MQRLPITADTFNARVEIRTLAMGQVVASETVLASQADAARALAARFAPLGARIETRAA